MLKVKHPTSEELKRYLQEEEIPADSCLNCHHWRSSHHPVLHSLEGKEWWLVYEGWCHRYPPAKRIRLRSDDPDEICWAWLYPETSAWDYCGEWMRKLKRLPLYPFVEESAEL